VEGRRRVEEARERGRTQYNDLVATIEKKYLAEFETSMQEIRAKAEADNKASSGRGAGWGRGGDFFAGASGNRKQNEGVLACAAEVGVWVTRVVVCVCCVFLGGVARPPFLSPNHPVDCTRCLHPFRRVTFLSWTLRRLTGP
jgi:hypothetical protein